MTRVTEQDLSQIVKLLREKEIVEHKFAPVIRYSVADGIVLCFDAQAGRANYKCRLYRKVNVSLSLTYLSRSLSAHTVASVGVYTLLENDA
jgi:hypothetical protein